MHTIKLKINDNIYDKLLFLLNKFDKSELEIITDDNEFNDNKRYLEAELNEIISGKSTFIGLEDLDSRLERVIGELDNPESNDQKNI
jgi:hypothetical protein